MNDNRFCLRVFGGSKFLSRHTSTFPLRENQDIKKTVYRLPSIDSIEREMAHRGRAIASRYLVCASCSSWVQFDSSGCTNSWAEMRGGCLCFHMQGV